MPDVHYADAVVEMHRDYVRRLEDRIEALLADARKNREDCQKLRDELADTRIRLARFAAGARN